MRAFPFLAAALFATVTLAGCTGGVACPGWTLTSWSAEAVTVDGEDLIRFTATLTDEAGGVADVTVIGTIIAPGEEDHPFEAETDADGTVEATIAYQDGTFTIQAVTLQIGACSEDLDADARSFVFPGGADPVDPECWVWLEDIQIRKLVRQDPDGFDQRIVYLDVRVGSEDTDPDRILVTADLYRKDGDEYQKIATTDDTTGSGNHDDDEAVLSRSVFQGTYHWIVTSLDKTGCLYDTARNEVSPQSEDEAVFS